MLGAFQNFSKAWMVEKIPDKFCFQLLEPDWEKFAEPLKNGKHRIPALESAKFARFVNGPESFTLDGNFILGEAPELRGYFVCAGFNSAGIANAGGATMGYEHFTVNRFDGFDSQVLECLAQESRLKRAAFILIKRLAVVAAVSGSIAGWIGVRTIEPPVWTVTLT